MVHQNKSEMGQAGLCSLSAPQTSLTPLNSTAEMGQEQIPNRNPNDLMAMFAELIANKYDINTEELLLKLQSVIAENFELKDTISQNNMALRQQMNLLVQWSKQVDQQQRHFRQEINESNKKVSSLQQENSVLKATLSNFKNPDSSSPGFEELDKTIENLNEQLDFTEQKLQEALEEKETLSALRSNLEGEVTLLKCDLTATRSECERLLLQSQELISTVKNMRDDFEGRKLDMHQTAPSADAIANLSLEEARRKLQKEGENNLRLLQELQSSLNQVEYLEAELKISREETAKYKSRYQMSSRELTAPGPPSSVTDKTANESDFRRVRDEAASLRDEVEALEAALAEERRRTKEERESASLIQTDNARLRRDLSEARDRAERNHLSDQYYMTKLKSLQELHDEATAKTLSYEELIGSKNDEVARLKRDLGRAKAALAEMQSEGDTIAVLRAQVEVYQSDFRAEREAREAMASEREKLREDMRHLQMRNTQLMDELESYQRRHYNQGAGRSSRAGSEDPKESSLNPEAIWDKLSSTSDNKKSGEEASRKEDSLEVDENLLYCPKCSKSFAELRPLEEHVNRCLDED